MEDQRAEEIWWENEFRSGRDPSKVCGCPINIQPPTYPITYPSYNSFALAFALCGRQERMTYKNDCYFYHEEKDMLATIPVCSYHKKGLGYCPCDSCQKYISNADVYKMAKDAVNKKR